MNTSGDRLRLLLRECHLSASDFAANRRVTPQHVNNWFKRGIPMARLDEIAELLCVNSRWLRTGEGSKHPKGPSTHEPLRAPSEAHLTPLRPTSVTPDRTDARLAFYNEVLTPCGTGTRVMEIPDGHIRLDNAILRAAAVSPEHAICVPMIGNSMAQKIQSGSTLAVDSSLTHIVDGEIYALEQDGMLRIKYAYRLPGDGLRLRSHNNSEYPDETYSAEQIQALNIRILGWVFWWSTLNTRRPAVPHPLEDN
ncbi:MULTISPECIES: XRE family transcriptional regulator [Pseudomonas]|uniref:Transcriptional regulator n=1 Tax=Pseudomonas lundensis TaxID=86185 RepID=A0A266NGJ9_9PSED|nr:MULTISPECIES: XRE family transcriptional regulator [Pseudomonas]NMY75628.1 helix-turn-helix transcriptional regulator [Pseudomonas sp. WS 5071]OZY60895.1 transcriptional regulator [Pseudomonas lundensis]